MFIQTETTPNPATLKFLPGKVVIEAGTADFPSVDSVNGVSPLAEKLFAVSGVTGVFYGYDFITITKDDSLDWQHLKPSILATIMEYFMSGAPVMTASQGGVSADSSEEFYDEADANIVSTIKELLETRVRPAVAQDGGDITFHGYKEGKVFLHMKGACAGCPSSTATLKHGIQNLLRHFIPEVEEVEAV